jgi:hypothetical protein
MPCGLAANLSIVARHKTRSRKRALIPPPASPSSRSIRLICSSICTISARDCSIISRLVAICAKVSSRVSLRNLRCALNCSTSSSPDHLLTTRPFKAKSGFLNRRSVHRPQPARSRCAASEQSISLRDKRPRLGDSFPCCRQKFLGLTTQTQRAILVAS